jgi:alpha-tubulin suppressor-like RCC1 family protein
MIMSLRDEIIKEVCCGHCHTLAFNLNGQLFAWGLNESGQLGLGVDAPPVLRRPVLNPHISNIAKLSAGNEHSLAINKQGELYIWGGGGLTGFGDTNPRFTPTKLDYFTALGTKV